MRVEQSFTLWKETVIWENPCGNSSFNITVRVSQLYFKTNTETFCIKLFEICNEWYTLYLSFNGLQEPSARSFSYVELRIHSNHGNPEYTCLYRFRVHGNLKHW